MDGTPSHKQSGISAMQEMETMVGEVCAARLLKPQDDLITSIIQNTNLNRDVTAQDTILTLLDIDLDTSIGGLSNLWFNLLTNPTEMEKVSDDRRMLKFAWLETLRFSPPVLSAERFAKYEIERFGRLIPQGGLLMCSAAAANRDPGNSTTQINLLSEEKIFVNANQEVNTGQMGCHQE